MKALPSIALLAACGGHPATVDAPAATTDAPITGGSGLPLVSVADVPLPGAANRFDYQDIDQGKNQLVVAHMNAGSVLILSLADGSVKKELPNIPTPRASRSRTTRASSS